MLDPEAAAYLQLVAANPLPELPTIEEIRIARALGNQSDGFGGALEPNVRIEHRFVTTPTSDCPIKIYTPESVEPLNGMLFFHGGGWVFNHIGKYDAELTAMAHKTKSVIISVNYQKAPEHKFPIAFDDCYAAFEWVCENAENLEIRSGKIGVAGDSAGANLAAAVALAARDRGAPAIAYQWLLYPACNAEFPDSEALENGVGVGLTQKRLQFLWGQYLNSQEEKRNPYLSPFWAESHNNLPAAVVATAEYDVLRGDGIAYANKLKSAGVVVSHKDFPGMIHGFFTLGSFISEGIRARDFFAREINAIIVGS